MLLTRIRTWLVVFGLMLTSVAHASIMPPDQLVKQITQETYVYVNQDTALQKGDTTKLVEWAEKSVLSSFDFNRMTSLAVGKDWRLASPEQKKQIVHEFRKLLIRTFANAFVGIKKEQTIEYKPFKMNPDEQDVVVKTLVIKPGAKPIDVNFSLEKSTDSWKVYDVTVAGISLVTNYRDQFAQEVRSGGVDGLIATVAAKNKSLESSLAKAEKK